MIVSILTLASFTKVFFSAFTGPVLPEYKDVQEVPKSLLIGMGIMVIIIIAFSLFPGLVIDHIVRPASEALINQATYISSIMGGL